MCYRSFLVLNVDYKRHILITLAEQPTFDKTHNYKKQAEGHALVTLDGHDKNQKIRNTINKWHKISK